ncbi:hypothetical protein K503DRAFT_743039 [Rhizopogon vinicolor AM-OR11-026]|uniref:F-box domain-containing protein n=1 Tax=Rhizopogon vinicolor AM-OR11-026 TaxID=1314800 RepID=A0A1B7MXC1_9AGAM|nr:hypothetical protein K503DRAFT_743039 [Rhizopogon vinicolor AM-OR11-026]
MDTRGLSVYRSRNMYFSTFNNFDAHPEALGMRMLRYINRPGTITKKRQWLAQLSGMGDQCSTDLADDQDDPRISKQRPQIDFTIEWIYEMDLDRNIFHINGIPFFSLEYLPSPYSFLEYISKDHYGNVACAPACPPGCKYNKPVPPSVHDSDLATYQSLACTGAHIGLSDLLAISDALSPGEHVRVPLLETMIGQCMIRSDTASLIYELELASNHDQLMDEEWLTACTMANFAFVPQMFGTHISHPQLNRKEFTWVREDTVVCISTHLDDERCLQASISRLIDAILEEKDNPGDYFGVAFSVYHCAIVKVVKDAHITTFSHTTPFEFLPSFYADSPSTPGITALARLGNRVDPALFVRIMEINQTNEDNWHTYQQKSPPQGVDDTLPKISCKELPIELWREVALHLQSSDLIAFGLVSDLCREAATMVLRYPHVCGYRLVAVAKEKPQCLLHPGEYRFLHNACFSAAQAGIPANVLVGSESQNNIISRIKGDTHGIMKRLSAEISLG